MSGASGSVSEEIKAAAETKQASATPIEDIHVDELLRSMVQKLSLIHI